MDDHDDVAVAAVVAVAFVALLWLRRMFLKDHMADPMQFYFVSLLSLFNLSQILKVWYIWYIYLHLPPKLPSFVGT